MLASTDNYGADVVPVDDMPIVLLGPGDLGFFKRIARGVKRGVRATGRGVKRGARATARAAKTGVKAGYKVAKTVATLPLRLLMQAAIRLGAVVCSLPPGTLRVAATAAGATYDVIPLFCEAIKVRRMSDIRRYLPQVIKIAAQVAATSSVPGLGPALSIIRTIPGFSGPATLGDYDSDVQEDVFLGRMSDADIASVLADMTDDEIAEGLGVALEDFGAAETPEKVGNVVLLTVFGVLAGYGLYRTLKDERTR